MKQGFWFGLGVMLGLLTPAVVLLTMLGVIVGVRDWLLKLSMKTREVRAGKSSNIVVIYSDGHPRGATIPEGHTLRHRRDLSVAYTHHAKKKI